MNKKLKYVIITLTISFSTPLGIKYRVFAQADSYTLGNMQKYRLVESYTLKNDPDAGAKGSSYDLTTIVKMGTDFNSPYIINVGNFKSSEGTISKDANGMYILTLPTKAELKVGETITFNIEREFETGTIQYNIDKSKVTSNYSELPNYQEYLKTTDFIQVNDPLIQKKAMELTQKIDNPYDKAHSIFEYVNLNMEYDKGEYAHKGALSALTYHKGGCQDYAQLFVALCRASGIPARTVSGYRNVQANNTTDTIDLTGTNHMWAEFYLPGYGWTIAEPTVELKDTDGNKLLAENWFAKQLNSAEHIGEIYGKDDNVIKSLADLEFYYDQSAYRDTSPVLKKTENIKLYRINESETKLIAEAIQLVEKVEQTKTQEDLDKAKNMVDSLKDGVTKNELNDRINKVQECINVEKAYQTQLAAATTAVEKGESSKLQGDVDGARPLVNALRDSAKATLGARLDAAQKAINNKGKEDTAINLVGTAEYNLTRESYNSAANALNNLENGTTKTSLQDRLNSVLRAIQSKENSQGNGQFYIYGNEEQTAFNLVAVCEKNITKENYNSALNAVNNLPYGSVKTSLQCRVYQFMADLNNKDTAVNAVTSLYNNLTLDNYKKTVKIVYNLKPEIPERKDLLNRLDDMLMRLVTKNNTRDSKEIIKILSSINDAERNLNTITYNYAYRQIGKLDGLGLGELKPILMDRLSVVNNKIDDRKHRNKFPELKQYPFLETTDTGKIWNVSFNKQLDKKTVNTNNIYIKDSKGNNIKCILYCNGNNLNIRPIGGYTPNEQYAIYINSKVKSIDNKSISNGYYIIFEITK